MIGASIAFSDSNPANTTQRQRIRLNPTGIHWWMRVFGFGDILGSEYAPAYYPGVAQASQAQVVSVKAGDEVQADIFMQRAKTVEIAGHVIGRVGATRRGRHTRKGIATGERRFRQND